MSISTIQYEELFRSNHKNLCRLANRIVNDKAGAEDIVQDIFLKVWNSRDSIQTDRPLDGYLYTATTNAALNYLESLNRLNKFRKEFQPSNTENASQNITSKELQAEFQKALDRLPPKCKVIFALSRFEELRYKQIAEQLNISIKTVENQMGKALEIMREELRPFLTREFLIVAATVGLSALLRFLSLFLIILQIGQNF